jgi:hypothetical protein
MAAFTRNRRPTSAEYAHRPGMRELLARLAVKRRPDMREIRRRVSRDAEAD